MYYAACRSVTSVFVDVEPWGDCVHPPAGAGGCTPDVAGDAEAARGGGRQRTREVAGDAEAAWRRGGHSGDAEAAWASLASGCQGELGLAGVLKDDAEAAWASLAMHYRTPCLMVGGHDHHDPCKDAQGGSLRDNVDTSVTLKRTLILR